MKRFKLKILLIVLLFSLLAFLFIQIIIDKYLNAISEQQPEFSYSMQTFNRLIDIVDKNYQYSDTFNYEGTLSWGGSYLQQGYIYAYKATKNRQYLDKLIKQFDLVIAHRNDRVGTSDFRRQSSPAWRADGHYTFATVILEGEGGKKILKLKTNFYTAGSCTNNRRSCMQVEVSPGTKPHTFKVRLVYQKPIGTNLSDYLFDNLTMDQQSPNYAVDIINAGFKGAKPVTAIRLSHASDMTQPSHTQLTDFEDGYYDFMVHSAMICYPMAMFAEEVYNSDLKYNNFYREKADEYIDRIKESISYHDSEFNALSDGSGYFKFISNNPAGLLDEEVPYNMELAMGRTMLRLLSLPSQAPITKAERMLYQARVEALAKNFQKSLRVLDDGYIWEYEKGGESIENPVHGHIDAQFLYQAYKAGIVFTKDDLKK